MTNILLADEINRTIPRTHASLLESMEERQVTVDGRTLKPPSPFFVIASTFRVRSPTNALASLAILRIGRPRRLFAARA